MEEKHQPGDTDELQFLGAAILDNIAGMVVTSSPDGAVRGVNRQFLNYTGKSLEEIKRSGLGAFVHTDDLELAQAARARLIGPDAAPTRFDVRLRRADGAYRWFDSRGVPALDGSGRVSRWDELLIDIDERKAAEQRALASERDLRVLVDSIPAGVAFMSPSGEFEVINQYLLTYFGWTLGELPRWGGRRFVHPDDRERSVEAFNHALATGDPFLLEQRQKRADGTFRWFEAHVRAIRDTSGNIVRWHILHVDIDDRKRAEEALIASERNARLIVDSIPGMVVVFSASGETEAVNSQVLQYFGATLEQLRDWQAGGFTHPEDGPRAVEAFTRSMSLGEPFEWETRARRHDGAYRWFQTRGTPLRDASGRIVRWYNLLTDIDDRKRAESELRRAYNSLADAQRLSRTGSFGVDPLIDEHTWSDETYRIFEFEPGTKVTRQRVREVVHPDDLPTLESVYENSSEGEDVTFEYRIVTASGAVKHLRGLEHLSGEVAGRPQFIGALQDVTETKLAEQALDKARSELAHASRAMSLGVLTASIAHEVNQPLSGILANAGAALMMLSADPPNVEAAIETTRRTIRDGARAAEIVTRLRALFGRKEFAAEPVDLNAATREVLELTRHELQRNRIALHVQLDEQTPRVIGDHVQLQQVILNLILNASDATKVIDDRPRQIFIETANDAGAARCSVRDTGVGIPPESLAKLFDAFFTTKADGMGIGLSVSRTIVERHGGRLWATANDGPGVTFTFSVPDDGLTSRLR